MKYVSPKYEISALEACDIIMSNEKYEVQNNNDGSGNVIMKAVDLFR